VKVVVVEDLKADTLLGLIRDAVSFEAEMSLTLPAAPREVCPERAVATALARSGMDQPAADDNERRETTQNSADGCLKVIDIFRITSSTSA